MGANNSSTEEEEMFSTTNETDPEDGCDVGDKEIDLTFKVYLFISVLMTFGLSFVVRRRQRWPGCCWGRPGLLQPLNFMDEIGRRWAYAACFVIIANDIIPMFFGESHFELIPKDDAEWMRKYGWVSVFYKFFEAMCICLVFYPLLACVDHRHYIAANVVGILYLIPWIYTYTEYFCICRIGEGFIEASVHLIKIPIYIAFYVVGISYVLDLVRNCIRIRDRRRRAVDKTSLTSSNAEKRIYKIGHHFQYVVNLLHKRSPEQIDETKSALKVKSKKLIKKVKYDKILGFCYSTRIVCCLTVSSTFLIWIMISAAATLEVLIQLIIVGCDAVKDSEFGSIFETFCEYVIVTRTVLHVANVLAGLVIAGFFLNTLIAYKRRWHQLLRGDHSWHPYGGSMIVSPQSTLLNGLKFAGYQAAYGAWGWIVLMLTISIILMFLSFVVIIPLKNGEQNWFIRMILRLCANISLARRPAHYAGAAPHQVRNIEVIGSCERQTGIQVREFVDYVKCWTQSMKTRPTVILGLLIALAQKLICRFCFLQDKGSVMALDNRRAYNAVSYYFLVLNVIVGFFSCLKRILVPLVLGVTFLSRLDRPLVMSGFETHDPGFVSFVSMLLVDLYHNHPVVKTFVELLLKVREKREQQEQQNQDPQNPEQQKQPLTGKSGEDAALEAEKRKRSKMIRNRWLKTVTLVNNPSLAVKVIEQRLKDERRNAEQIATLTIKVKEDLVAIEMQPLNDNTATTTVYKL